jgi:very-short-patch-repair endonuclease
MNVFKEWHTDPELWDKLKPIAREMRHKPTEGEKLLWAKLRAFQLSGYKFRRQHNIERFIVDFCCPDTRLIVEVDGEIHQYHQEEDLVRQKYLQHMHYSIIRFTNDEVLTNIERVLGKILECLNLSSADNESAPPLRARRGGTLRG